MDQILKMWLEVAIAGQVIGYGMFLVSLIYLVFSISRYNVYARIVNDRIQKSAYGYWSVLRWDYLIGGILSTTVYHSLTGKLPFIG